MMIMSKNDFHHLWIVVPNSMRIRDEGLVDGITEYAIIGLCLLD